MIVRDMQDSQKLSRWFYRSPKTNTVEGPYDLVELAGFLASGDITPETLVRSEEAEQWVVFRDHREFRQAKEMPLGVIMRHLDIKKQAEEQKSPFTLRRLYYFVWFLGGFFLYILSLWIYSNRHRNDSNEWLLTIWRILSNTHQ